MEQVTDESTCPTRSGSSGDTNSSSKKHKQEDDDDDSSTENDSDSSSGESNSESDSDTESSGSSSDSSNGSSKNSSDTPSEPRSKNPAGSDVRYVQLLLEPLAPKVPFNFIRHLTVCNLLLIITGASLKMKNQVMQPATIQWIHPILPPAKRSPEIQVMI